MTDYPKALAALREALANYLQFGALLDDSPAALELAKRAGNYLATLEAQVPVAWVDEFGNAYPLAAYNGNGHWRDGYKRQWRRAYAAPVAPAAAVPAVTPEMTIAGMKAWDMKVGAGVRDWPSVLEAVFIAMLAAANKENK